MGETCHIIWYDEIDSTNSEAVRRLGELANMSVIAARCQTAGRGKGSRKWLAAPGENLTFTLVLKYAETGNSGQGTEVTVNSGQWNMGTGNLFMNDRAEAARPWPPFPASCQMLLSAATAASVVKFLEEQGVSAWVKWPNDIYVGGEKICGILIEHRMHGDCLTSSIIGVGLNLNQTEFPPELVNPVSVASLTGKRLDTDASLGRFCEIFTEKIRSAYRSLPHLRDVISGASACEDGASGDENLRACFAQCVNVLL